MKIAAVGTALPPNYYGQDELLAAFRQLWSGRVRNLDRLERLHRNVLVGGRHLALPLEEYEALETWGDANDAWIRVAQDVGEAAIRQALERAGLERRRGRRADLRHRHRRGDAVDRRPPDEPAGAAAAGQADADLRSRLRRRRRRHRPRRRLRQGLPRPGGGAAVGGAVLADPAAQGPVDPQPDLLRAVWRRRGGGGGGRRRARGRRPAHRRHAVDLLPRHRAGDGLGDLGEGVPGRPVGRGAGDGARPPAPGRRPLPGRPRHEPRGDPQLGRPPRRPRGARGDGRRPWSSTTASSTSPGAASARSATCPPPRCCWCSRRRCASTGPSPAAWGCCWPWARRSAPSWCCSNGEPLALHSA